MKDKGLVIAAALFVVAVVYVKNQRDKARKSSSTTKGTSGFSSASGCGCEG